MQHHLRDVNSDEVSQRELTEHELLIARKAARIALEELSDEFYRQIGKTMIGRVLSWVGMLAMAGLSYAIGRGWITLK